MSLYVCTECGNIENTALSRFHMGSSKCAGCDPEFDVSKPGFPAVTAANRKPPTKPEAGDKVLVRRGDDGIVVEITWPG